MAGSGRQRADALVIAALMSGATIGYASLRSGVPERTIQRRLADPTFRAKLEAAQAELVAATARVMLGSTTEATANLIELMRVAPPAVRLGAARTIFELAGKWRFEVELEERLAALEQAVVELRSER